MPIYREKRFGNRYTNQLTDEIKNDVSIANKILPAASASNPPFDPRITRLSGAGGVRQKRLNRGRIVQLQTPEGVDLTGSGVQEQPVDGALLPPGFSGSNPLRSVNFLWNPTEIGVNYSFDTDSVPPTARALDSPPEILLNSQTASWRIHFNRQYEVSADPSNPGVLADVQALEYMVGARDGKPLQYASYVMVVFGATDGKKAPFAYTGFITNFDVTYAQFSNRMIPTIAIVGIGLSRRFVGPGSFETSSGVHEQPVEGALQPPGFSRTLAPTHQPIEGALLPPGFSA